MTPSARVATALIAALSAPAAVLAQSDDFNDNLIGPQWSLLTDAPGELNLIERNNRLEVIAGNAPSLTTDALYVSNGAAGFRMSTASDFEIALDYDVASYASTGGTPFDSALAAVFGVGRDLEGTDGAAVSYTLVQGESGVVFRQLWAIIRIDDEQFISQLQPTTTTPGTIGTYVLSYDATGDDLTFAADGRSYTLDDTVRTVWGATDGLFVSFGARGNGFSTDGGIRLDNFQIRSGEVIPIPEPTGLALAGVAMGLLLRRRSATRK